MSKKIKVKKNNIISERTYNVFVKYSMEQELPTLPGHLSLARFGAFVWHVRWLSALCFINNCLSVLMFSFDHSII